MKPNGSIEAACLLDGLRGEGMPKIGELVDKITPRGSIYGLMSVTAHGSRIGVHRGFEITRRGPEKTELHFTGFGLAPNSILALALLAELKACQRIAGWNGLSADKLEDAMRPLQVLLW